MRYRLFKTEEEYFKGWKKMDRDALSDEQRKYIYAKYVAKFKVFNRDGHKCRNLNCRTPERTPTFHHIKFKKNGGKWTERNGVSLCDPCQKGYHNGSLDLRFPNEDNLPPRIKGQILRIHQEEDDVIFKVDLSEQKKIRKNHKHLYNFRISWGWVAILMKWLSVPYYDMA